MHDRRTATRRWRAERAATFVGAAAWAAAWALAVAVPRTEGADETGKASSVRWSEIKFETFAVGPSYSEGPSWRDGRLFFCSDGLRRADGAGRVELHLDVSPAGTAFATDGRLLICDNRHKALLQLRPDGRLEVLADACDGRPLRSLNDLTFDAEGNCYWTDPEGSSLEKPVGRIFRLGSDGKVDQVADGLAFPNGIEVDPSSRRLYVIESQSKRILRYALPAAGRTLGPAEQFYDLGGSGGDGCAFDVDGNLWVADFHRPETGRGRITVLSPAGAELGRLDVPAKVVSNITFGGERRERIFCTTGEPPGATAATVGVAGFAGHAVPNYPVLKRIAVAPHLSASHVHPRRFGSPGGPGVVRGWYHWLSFDAATRTAEVRRESDGRRFTTRVLPWCTTYRHLVYGGGVDDLLPGERVNLFFAPDETDERGWLVHFQDEIGQMKGHGHVWTVRSSDPDGAGFSATPTATADDKPLEAEPRRFELDGESIGWRDGARVDAWKPRAGERVYLTWVEREGKRRVRWAVDGASLGRLQEAQERKVAERAARDGLGALVEAIEPESARLLIYPTAWAQAGRWKSGQKLQISIGPEGGRAAATPEPIDATAVSLKNLGEFGSGAVELTVRLERAEQAEALRRALSGREVRVRAAAMERPEGEADGGEAPGRSEARRPAGLQHKLPADVGMDSGVLAKIDELADEAIRAKKTPGCVVCVGRRGAVVWLKAYGRRQVEPVEEAMTTDTLFDLASLTKPIATAASVMVLAERGVVDLNDTVAKHIPEFGVNGKEAVSIRDLLIHQSGLIADNPLSDYEQGREEALRRIFQLKTVAGVGEKFIYSDVNYIVLGELVRRKTEQDLGRFVKAEIFERLGMAETGFLPPLEWSSRAAPTGRDGDRWLRGRVHDPRAARLGGVAGHAGLFSTASDLAIFAQMLLQGGEYGGVRVMRSETVELMTGPNRVSSGLRGLGWDVKTGYSSNRGENMSERAFGHGGFTGTTFWVDPPKELFVVFLSNRLHPDGKGVVNPLAGKIGGVAVEAIVDD